MPYKTGNAAPSASSYAPKLLRACSCASNHALQNGQHRPKRIQQHLQGKQHSHTRTSTRPATHPCRSKTHQQTTRMLQPTSRSAADNETGPPGNETEHGGQRTRATGKEQSTPTNTQDTPDNETGPPGNEQGPPDNEQRPPGNEQGPPGNEQGPPGNEQGPTGNEQGPTGNEAANSSNNAQPTGLPLITRDNGKNTPHSNPVAIPLCTKCIKIGPTTALTGPRRTSAKPANASTGHAERWSIPEKTSPIPVKTGLRPAKTGLSPVHTPTAGVFTKLNATKRASARETADRRASGSGNIQHRRKALRSGTATALRRSKPNQRSCGPTGKRMCKPYPLPAA